MPDYITRFTADTRGIRRGSREAEQAINRFVRSARRDFQVGSRAGRQFSDSVFSTFRSGAVALVGFEAARRTARALVNAADEITNIQNRLRSARASATLEDVVGLSNDTLTSIQATGVLVSRIALTTQQFNISQERQLRIARAIQQTYALSGATIRESVNSTIQFTQGLASNRLAGDELRGVLEGNARLSRALAEGLGLSGVGELREQAEAGLLTTQRVLAAIETQAEDIDGDFQNLTRTFGQAFQVAANGATALTAEISNMAADAVNLRQVLIGVGDELAARARGVRGFRALVGEIAEQIGRQERVAGAAFDYDRLQLAFVTGSFGITPPRDSTDIRRETDDLIDSYQHLTDLSLEELRLRREIRDINNDIARAPDQRSRTAAEDVFGPRLRELTRRLDEVSTAFDRASAAATAAAAVPPVDAARQAEIAAARAAFEDATGGISAGSIELASAFAVADQILGDASGKLSQAVTQAAAGTLDYEAAVSELTTKELSQLRKIIRTINSAQAQEAERQQAAEQIRAIAVRGDPEAEALFQADRLTQQLGKLAETAGDAGTDVGAATEAIDRMRDSAARLPIDEARRVVGDPTGTALLAVENEARQLDRLTRSLERTAAGAMLLERAEDALDIRRSAALAATDRALLSLAGRDDPIVAASLAVADMQHEFDLLKTSGNASAPAIQAARDALERLRESAARLPTDQARQIIGDPTSQALLQVEEQQRALDLLAPSLLATVAGTELLIRAQRRLTLAREAGGDATDRELRRLAAQDDPILRAGLQIETLQAEFDALANSGNASAAAVKAAREALAEMEADFERLPGALAQSLLGQFDPQIRALEQVAEYDRALIPIRRELGRESAIVVELEKRIGDARRRAARTNADILESILGQTDPGFAVRSDSRRRANELSEAILNLDDSFIKTEEGARLLAAAQSELEREQRRIELGDFALYGDDVSDAIRGSLEESIREADFDDFGRRVLDAIAASLLSRSLDEVFSNIDFGAILGSIASGFGFGGGRQYGGPVRPGQFYTVGEAGPEVLLPQVEGTVIPLDQIRGGNQFVFAPQLVGRLDDQVDDVFYQKAEEYSHVVERQLRARGILR